MDTRKAFQFSDRTRNLGVEMGDLQLYDFFAGAIASVLDNNIDIHLSHRPIVTMNLSSDSDKRRCITQAVTEWVNWGWFKQLSICR